MVLVGAAARACLVGDRCPGRRAPFSRLPLSQGETCPSPPGRRWCPLTFRRGRSRNGLPGPVPAFGRRGGRSRGLRAGRRRDPRRCGALHLVAAGSGSRGCNSQVARRGLSRRRVAGPDASPRRVPPPGTIVNVDTGDPGDLRVLDHAEGELEDVERALRRLDEGTYAICEACGRAIGEDRLARSAGDDGAARTTRRRRSRRALRLGSEGLARLRLFAQARDCAGTSEAEDRRCHSW